MRWFDNLSIGMKLSIAFGVLIAILIVVMATAYTGLQAIQASQHDLHANYVASMMTLQDLNVDMNRSRALVLELALTKDMDHHARLKEEIEETRPVIDANLQAVATIKSQDGSFLTELNAIRSALTEYRQTRNQLISMIEQGRTDEAIAITTGAQAERFERIRAGINTLVDQEKQNAETGIKNCQLLINRLLITFLAVLLGAIVVSLVIVVGMGRAVAGPLRVLTDAASRISLGDLRVDLPATARRDEVGQLTRAFNEMGKMLRQMNQQLKEGINVLSTSGTEIAASSTQVASSASETAAAVTETTSTVEEVKHTVTIASQKARQVAERAQSATEVAQSGRVAVDAVTEAMQRIREQMASISQSILRLSEQGRSIGEIIATVNELAEQSNLLAVNAAIEAARAGEQGRGFAVVAQEVKSLAEQSKQATAQVRTILGDIQGATGLAVMATEQGSKSVDSGVQQANEAGKAIRLLTESLADAAQAATQIAASSQQQLAGMDQVAEAMVNINQASAQNVTGTKQTEVAAQSIRQLGYDLKQMMDRFTV